MTDIAEWLCHPAHEIHRTRVAEEMALQEQLDALRQRLLDVPEYLDLAARLQTLRTTPLDCGCHCSGWCGGYNPCRNACSVHMCR